MTPLTKSGRHRVYVALGSNLGDPVAQITRALDALQRIDGAGELRRSSLYLTRPLGPANQPEYVNAVALLETRLTPEALLDALQAIEARQGRVRGPERWGPRTLDLDILLYDDLCIATQRLIVPHPGLHLRPFVLHPLAEIAPDLVVPGLGPVRELRDGLDSEGVERLA
jgi:2-amino-4-hydroxy-6-hydroxymethyldihydropteridine diphosphokinase